jgi:RNA polymerase sigma-70 factor (ECF subfamily)
MSEKFRDADLIARIRAGDKSACEDCVQRHAPGIYRLALRLMHNEEEAEDVMQETFLNAFKAIDRFDGRSELLTWLYRIAYNAAMARLRRRQPESVPVEEAADPQDGSLVPKELFDWSSLPERELEKAELRAEMEKAVLDLPEKLRSVFVMREMEDLSTEAVAEALGIKVDLVKTRLHRARLGLRERLSAYFAHNMPKNRG